MSALGIALYVIAMCTGGWIQGTMMNDPSLPFIASVNATKPYLWARSVGGTMMLIGHLVFAYQFVLIIYRSGPARYVPAWFELRPTAESAGEMKTV